jgi:hypothetical protein
MLDTLINSIGPDVLSAVTDKFGLSQEEASKTVDTTKSSLETSVKSEVGKGNLDGLLSLFDTGANSTDNSTFQRFAGNLSGDYIQKLGLSPDLANKISTYVLPLVIGKFSSQTGGQMDKEGLMGMLGPGASNLLKGKGGDLLKGGLGNLFK